MSKADIMHCLMSIALIAYMVVALSFTTRLAKDDTFKGIHINVADSTLRSFVTAQDIDDELEGISRKICSIRRDSLDTMLLERTIMSKDNIESANCMVLSDGSLRIDVVPLIPVARVFDTAGANYYVNRNGKRMKASVRYRMDVPVVTGNFTSGTNPVFVLPLLDYLALHPDAAAMTGAINVASNGDIIIVPTIKGHVINFGDTNDIANKMARLKTFYRKVMPVKGWEYYDTISVKWRGQIVAKRRNEGHQPAAPLEEEHIDLDDESTMLTSTHSDLTPDNT